MDPDVLVPRWEGKGHLSVKKGSSYVALATGPEQLRLRLTVMYNALAMIQLKHPGRNELADISADLFEKYKDYLLGDYVYGLRSAESAGAMIPPWTLVLCSAMSTLSGSSLTSWSPRKATSLERPSRRRGRTPR